MTTKQVCPACEDAAKVPTQSEILLACGEMTSGELRSVKAALNWMAQKVISSCRHADAPPEQKAVDDGPAQPSGATIRCYRCGTKQEIEFHYSAALPAQKADPAGAAPYAEKGEK